MIATCVNGVVRIREVPKEKNVRVLADAMVKNLAGMSLTKTDVVREFKVARSVATAVIHLLDGIGALSWDLGRPLPDGPLSRAPAGGWFERSFTVRAPPPPPSPPRETPAEAQHRRKMEGLYRVYGHGKCDRCGGQMPGKSQKNKHKRGHGQAICDLSLVRILMET